MFNHILWPRYLFALTRVSFFFCSAVTNLSRKFLTQRSHQMRKKWEETSQYTSARDLHQWVDTHAHTYRKPIISDVVLWLRIHFSSLLDRLERWKWRTLCLMTRLYSIRGIKSECWTLYTHRHTHNFSVTNHLISNCMHRNGEWGDKNDCFLVGPLLYLPRVRLLILQMYVGFLVNLFLSPFWSSPVF